MSFEITEKMIVNSIFGFGTLISVPTEAAPDPLFAEEEAQPLQLQSAEKHPLSCPASPPPPQVSDQQNENNQQSQDVKQDEPKENQVEIQNEKQSFPPPPLPIQPKIAQAVQPPNFLPPLGKPNKQNSQPPPNLEKQISLSDDPLPFSNSLPFQQPSQPETQTQSKKAPILKRLTSDLKESILLAKKLEAKYKFPYSNDERMVTLDFGLGKLSTMVKNISNVIILLIKTFFGQRYYYMAIVPISYTVEQLRSLIIDGIGQNQKMFHNIKLIHPMISLKELKDNSQKLTELSLKDFSQLLFLAEMTFTWDPIKKGKSIVLSNNNLTANKKGQSDYQTVLGTLALNSGRHYWEIKIDKFVDEEDIFIGIARKEIELYTQPTTTGHFYGYICLCARKFGADGQITDYGYQAVQNDTIGVLLEFRSGLGTLSFYRNGVKCGEAFNNLTGTFYPALCMFYGEVQVTLDSKAPLPAS